MTTPHRTIIVLAITGSVAASLVAQVPLPPTPAFEVVSIKPNKSGEANSRIAVQPGGRYAWVNTTLKSLIGMAYQRRAFGGEVLGGPSWIGVDRFDFVAQAETTPRVDADGFPRELFAMVRRALEERFKVAAHFETRDRPIFALVHARSDRRLGPNLRKSDVDCAAVMRDEVQAKRPPDAPSGGRPCAVGTFPAGLRGRALTMEALAGVLQQSAGRAVVDKTGLAGSYDFDIEFEQDLRPPTDSPEAGDRPTSNGPSIFTALQEQLGLKLESTRGPVDVLVIDHAEQPSPD